MENWTIVTNKENIALTIIILVALFALLFLIGYLISKIIKKDSLLIAFVIWIMIFLSNLSMIIFNIPFAIGIKSNLDYSNGKVGRYISFGYVIEIKEQKYLDHSKYDVHFASIFK